MTSSSSSPTVHHLDVLTVGHALVDVLSPVDESLLVSENLAKGSMNLISDDGAAHLYGLMGPASETSGGSAANTAVGVVACGGTAGFVGTVGDDELGEIFAHDLRSTGVHYDTAPIAGAQTGRSFILITPDGERTMNTNIAVSDRVSMNDLRPDALEAASITYVEGYLFDDKHPLDGWGNAVDVIKAAGNRFSITLSDSFAVERHKALFLELLDGKVDVCFGNDDEVRALFDTDDLEVAIKEMEKRCDVAAITLGARGSILVSNGERVEVKAHPTQVVDTTGAGDLYAAGVLTGLAQGKSLEECGELGSRAASSIVSRVGARLTSLE